MRGDGERIERLMEDVSGIMRGVIESIERRGVTNEEAVLMMRSVGLALVDASVNMKPPNKKGRFGHWKVVK